MFLDRSEGLPGIQCHQAMFSFFFLFFDKNTIFVIESVKIAVKLPLFSQVATVPVQLRRNYPQNHRTPGVCSASHAHDSTAIMP